MELDKKLLDTKHFWQGAMPFDIELYMYNIAVKVMQI